MIERRMGLLGALLVLAPASVAFWGCSSSEDSTPSTGGTASTTGGTSATTGGTSGTTGGAAGTTGGTTGTTGGASGACVQQELPVIPAECRGIRTGMPCMAPAVPGTVCNDGLCGVADSGRRSCTCDATTGNWMCSSCSYDASPFKCPPAGLTACTTEVENQGCASPCAVCQKGTEVCACFWDDEGALIWDCDGPPSSWNSCTAP